MAAPPRRWAGYALLTAGLLLLFDTYTFIKTDWSPLQIPMSVPVELMFGYLLVLAGICTFIAPTLLNAVSEIAPDASMKLGQNLAYNSVEAGRRKRLPLKDRFCVLPNRGLISIVFLILLVPMFQSIMEPGSKGIYLRLFLQRIPFDEKCLSGAVVVTVKEHNGAIRIRLNGTEIQLENLQQALASQLSHRADWEVFVQGDENIELSDLMPAIEIIRSLRAKAIILTPALKKQLMDGCTRKLQVD
jgi:biopolymer transport protein ExbD